jgi:hypothetical protein
VSYFSNIDQLICYIIRLSYSALAVTVSEESRVSIGTSAILKMNGDDVTIIDSRNTSIPNTDESVRVRKTYEQ